MIVYVSETVSASLVLLFPTVSGERIRILLLFVRTLLLKENRLFYSAM